MPITAEELAGRIKNARENAGLTQEQVAQTLGLSRPGVSQLEQGIRAVSSLELERLADLFGVAIGSFFSESATREEALIAKLRSTATDKERNSLVNAASFCQRVVAELRNLEELLEVENDDAIAPAYPTITFPRKWRAIKQGENIAQQERQRMGLDDDPVVDVSSLLKRQGVRTFLFELPNGVSGFSLMDAQWGLVACVNREDHLNRRRFSWVHEYGHIVMDREQVAAVSRAKDNKTLCEVRANSFAAAFLMPEQGIGKAVLELGKGKPGRERVIIGGEVGEPVEASRRRRAADQNLAIEDVVRIAHRFGVSRIALLYRMKNLGLINQNQLDSLKEEDDLIGSAVAQSLGLDEIAEVNRDSHVPDDLKSHVMELGIRAYDRELISRSKLFEVCQMVGADESAVETVIAHRGLQRKSEVAIPEELA